jgi:phosphoribosylglycinamide formyltransferase 1
MGGRSDMELRLGLLASHGGSSVRAIIHAITSGHLCARAKVVISNNSDSQALLRARAEGIPAYHLSERTTGDVGMLDRAIRDTLVQHDVNLVVLSGYMKRVGPITLSTFRDRILNVHPALLPKYGGQGFYGRHVHVAVLAARETTTGVTVHLIDEEYDHGRIVGQREVPVVVRDTPETLAARVLDQEKRLYVEILQQVILDQLSLDS